MPALPLLNRRNGDTGQERVLAAVAVVCLALQVVSAAFLGKELETPNASTKIAENLARNGSFSVDAWHRLRGPAGPIPAEPLRAFQLPAEPLVLALGFRVLPTPLWRLIHVPVTVVLVTAIAAFAYALGGARLAIGVGIVTSLDPFVFVHGPVWDDTFLAAAAEWVVFAGLLAALGTPRSQRTGRAWGIPVLLACAAAVAAASRTQSQVVLGSLAIAVIAYKPWQQARAAAWAVAFGLVVSLAAWGARNAVVVGHFTVGSSHDGLTLFESNYQNARKAILETGTAEGLSPISLAAQFARTASLGEMAADRQFKNEAWAYIAAHPLDVAQTAGLKIVVSLLGVDFGQPFSSARNLVTVGSNLALLLVGSYGLWLLWGNARVDPQLGFALFLCALMTVTTVGMLVLGPVGLRYRISLAGFLYVGVSSAVLRAVSRTSLVPWEPAIESRPA